MRYATTTRIDFVDGGGKYELAASNPEVLGTVLISYPFLIIGFVKPFMVYL